MTEAIIRPAFPEKLECLLKTHQHEGLCGNQCGRFKAVYGGRGGTKSYAMADASLIRAASQYERVVGIRETMDSIEESVHHLLEKRLYDIGLTDQFLVEKRAITSRHQWTGHGKSEFIFAGVRTDPGKIKSLEGATIMWAEEAHGITDGSWDIVIPTIRWEDRETNRKSEIWIAWNSRYSTDATHRRFVLETPDSAILIKTTYLDNPWFPDVLRSDMERDRATSWPKYSNIWLGECSTQVEGAIFGEQMKAADEEKRICQVSYDRTRPVQTFWDLGFGDLMAIWFAQPIDGRYSFIDYEEGNGLTIADWVVKLQQKGYVYGADWLPHDGVDAMLHHRLTGDKTRSVEQLMREAGRNVRVAAKMAVHDRLNAARTIFSQCRFDAEKCRDGIQRLRHYQWGPPAKVGAAKTEVQRREPLHDAASHGADAFCTAAVSIKQPKNAVTVPARQAVEYSPYG